jgi:carboxymethylenebutenolidase
MISIVESKLMLPIKGANEMGVFAAWPEHGTKKGILVFQEGFGVNGQIKNIVRKLARAGYLAAAPELFHRTAPPNFELPYTNIAEVYVHINALTPEGLAADTQAVYAWVKNELKTETIGCLGFCMGGWAAYLANTHLPFKAAVSFYGSPILQEGPSAAANQQAPLLLIWGGRDKYSPKEKIKTVTDALKKNKKIFLNLEFPDADHGFNRDDRPSYQPEAAQLAWDSTLSFFQKNNL